MRTTKLTANSWVNHNSDWSGQAYVVWDDGKCTSCVPGELLKTLAGIITADLVAEEIDHAMDRVMARLGGK